LQKVRHRKFKLTPLPNSPRLAAGLPVMLACGLPTTSPEPQMLARAKTSRQKSIARALRVLAPRMPLADFNAVLQIAVAGHLRHLPPSIAAAQALTTHVRHAHSKYDRLLEEGYDRDSARHFVRDAMNEVLAQWGASPVAQAETG
jgi:hypothetical protein